MNALADLSPRQQQALEVITQHIAATGYPPTRTELARALGVKSANAAELHVQALARKGYLELAPGASRGIRLCRQPSPANTVSAGLPLIGRVAAGAPLLAVAHIEDTLAIDPALFHPRPDYLLRVEGLSMRDAGILPGDLLLVHATPEARNGQVVVARVDDEVTVKRYFRQGTTVTLAPENPDYTPLMVDLTAEHLAIEGLAVGVLRNQLS